MGIVTDLGYRHRTPNSLQRAMQAFGSTRGGAWFFSKTLPPVDRLLHRVGDGGTSLPTLLAGLPVLMVTTTGRRSGQARATPLIAVPVGDDLALLGTNFGQGSTPAWVLNLEADPHARVEFDATAVPVVARAADPDERAAVWDGASGVYGGYDKYQQRISGREIRVFVLEADPGGDAETSAPPGSG
jgi:deazaflavin-dependent oxidoreductase (nitroreductase family)